MHANFNVPDGPRNQVPSANYTQAINAAARSPFHYTTVDQTLYMLVEHRIAGSARETPMPLTGHLIGNDLDLAKAL
jgi:hypothetical protein